MNFDISPPVVTIPRSPLADTYAKKQFEIIKNYVLDFQRSLDPEHDVGLQLTNFGKSVLLEVTEISYEDPVLMVFRGFVDGHPSTLIQHISQLNFLLTTVPKPREDPYRPIGFNAPWE